MLKSKLEELVSQQQEKINVLKEEKRKLIEDHKNEIDKLLKNKDDSEYELWKNLNDKYLKRYIHEYIKDNLSIKTNCEYGYYNVQLLLNDECISTDEDYLDINHCGYDE